MRESFKKHIETQKQGLTKGDEYYTSYAEVEHIFNDLIDIHDLEGKVIYCPCDTDKSAFTTFLEQHKDEYKLKRFMHTSDDFRLHEDLFREADFVITNPPFSNKEYKDLLKLIRDNGCRFFLFGILRSLHRYLSFDPVWAKDFHFVTRSHKHNFITEDGSIYCVFGTLYFYNFSIDWEKEKKAVRFKGATAESCNTTFATEDGRSGIAVDYIRDLPLDYTGYIACPMSFLLDTNTHRDEYSWEYLNCKCEFSDGKTRYTRVIVKKKSMLEKVSEELGELDKDQELAVKILDKYSEATR